VPDAIRSLHEQWGADRLNIGPRLNATVEELRAAGCSPTEVLAAAQRKTLRSLGVRESTWIHVGPALLEAGYTTAEAVGPRGGPRANAGYVRRGRDGDRR
jgi:hypothetical protein